MLCQFIFYLVFSYPSIPSMLATSPTRHRRALPMTMTSLTLLRLRPVSVTSARRAIVTWAATMTWRCTSSQRASCWSFPSLFTNMLSAFRYRGVSMVTPGWSGPRSTSQYEMSHVLLRPACSCRQRGLPCFNPNYLFSLLRQTVPPCPTRDSMTALGRYDYSTSVVFGCDFTSLFHYFNLFINKKSFGLQAMCF